MIYILGLDGLDINLIKKWNLKYLQQKEYGDLWVPIHPKKGEPHSVQVWESFLTGTISKPREFDPGLNYKVIYPFLKIIKKIIPFKFGISRNIKDTNFPKLKQTTFLHSYKSKPINAPFYNFDNIDLKVTQAFASGIIDRTKMKMRLQEILDQQIRSIYLESEKSNNYDMIFSFLHYPDTIQHVCFKEIDFIELIYKKLSNLSFNILNDIEPNLFLIVSDHGFNFKTLKHSKNGFYSSNKTLNPKPNKITDFFEVFSDNSY